MARRPVILAGYDPEWPAMAGRHAARLRALAPVFVDVHHIGSTAVPNMVAKPVLDLIGVVTSLDDLDVVRGPLEALGYAWRGENGVAGRRYAVLAGQDGRRIVQLHCFAPRSPHIARHLAFRDYLRAHPAEAAAYAAEKQRARTLFPNDSAAYTEEKTAWTDARVLVAQAWQRRDRQSKGLRWH